MRLLAANVVIFVLSTGGPAEPLDTTGGTLRFHGTLNPVDKRWPGVTCGYEKFYENAQDKHDSPYRHPQMSTIRRASSAQQDD